MDPVIRSPEQLLAFKPLSRVLVTQDPWRAFRRTEYFGVPPRCS